MHFPSPCPPALLSFVILVRFTLLHFPDNATLGRLFLIGNHFACRSAPRVGRQIKSSRPSPDDQVVVSLRSSEAGVRLGWRTKLPLVDLFCQMPVTIVGNIATFTSSQMALELERRWQTQILTFWFLLREDYVSETCSREEQITRWL